MNFIFPLGIIIIPTDELIFFRGVGLNHQPVYVHPNEVEPNSFASFSIQKGPKFQSLHPGPLVHAPWLMCGELFGGPT